MKLSALACAAVFSLAIVSPVLAQTQRGPTDTGNMAYPAPVPQGNVGTTSTTGQNNSGLSLIKPKTTGSDPSGIRVAEMNATTKTVVRLYWGSANNVSRCSIQAGMSTV